MLFAILLPLLCIGVSSAMDDEPKCSRFEFEKHLLQMLVRLEFELSQTNQKLGLAEETMLMEIEELKQSNQNMRSELAAAALKEDTLKGEIEELKKNDRNMETELATFKDHSTKIGQNLEGKLAKEIEDAIQSMELKLVSSTPGSRIYFFGINPGSSTINNRPIFRTMVHNEGDSYDPSTGLFTCRVPGLYHFAFGFSSKADKYAHCWIYRNDDSLVHTYAKGQYNSGSVAAYLHLDVGNTVDIRCPSSFWTRMLHDRSMWYTGALIRR